MKGTLVTATEDLAARCYDIHWPDNFDPDHCDLFAHNEILIEAPPADIWTRLISAAQWPDWYSNARDVRVAHTPASLGPGVEFQWVTFGIEVSSVVGEFAPVSRVGWFTTAAGFESYHTWLLIPLSQKSTHLITEEACHGSVAQHFANFNPGQMHRGHDLWTVSLKFVCES
jgi:uncharacterized protein YndB with AHSA1/START domain